MSDDQLVELFEHTATVAQVWLDHENRTREHNRQKRLVVLDLEFRVMDARWAGHRHKPSTAASVVLKQVRSLDPSPPPVSGENSAPLPIPGDLLARASLVRWRNCRSDALSMRVLEVFSDPGASPDLGHAQQPFVAYAEVTREGQLLVQQDHRSALVVRRDETGQRLSLTLSKGHHAELEEGGVARVWSSVRADLSAELTCGVEQLWATPQRFLRSLLPKRG